jgi:thioredoxin-related protein
MQKTRQEKRFGVVFWGGEAALAYFLRSGWAQPGAIARRHRPFVRIVAANMNNPARTRPDRSHVRKFTQALAAFSIALVLLLITSCDSSSHSSDLGYDPRADAIADWHKALAEARGSKKRVLVIAGGPWCYYCRKLDSYLADNKDIDTQLHQSFVVLKVYYGDDNHNDRFFAKLPPARGYPHFWVLEGDGGAIFSDGISIDREFFLAFIKQYDGSQPASDLQPVSWN